MLHVQALSNLDEDSRRAWIDLVTQLNLNPTLAPGWLDVAARTIGRGVDVQVFAEGPDGSSRTGLLPFFWSRKRMGGVGMRVLELASNLISYHAEVVSTGNQGNLIRTFLAGMPRWDVFYAANLDVTGGTAEAIRAIAAETGGILQVMPSDVSPYLTIEGSWQQFLATRNKKFRYKLRHRQEVLSAETSSELVWFDSTGDVERLLSDIVNIESASWKVKAGMDIPSNPVEMEYHRQLLPFLADQRVLLANVLYVHGQPAAYSLCCHFDGWIGQLKTSFDDRLSHLSPGSIVVDASVERAFAVGAKEFDFLGQAQQHKQAWTSETRTHANYFLFGSGLKPRMIALLKRLKGRWLPNRTAQRGE